MRPTCTGDSVRMWTLLLPPALRLSAAPPTHQHPPSFEEKEQICVLLMFGHQSCDCSAEDDLFVAWENTKGFVTKKETIVISEKAQTNNLKPVWNNVCGAAYWYWYWYWLVQNVLFDYPNLSRLSQYYSDYSNLITFCYFRIASTSNAMQNNWKRKRWILLCVMQDNNTM